jgi:DNA-binding response OmpR family regulator
MAGTTSNKTTILVIDDSEELLEVFKFIFEKYDWEVITRTSLGDTFLYVQNNKIDILILDVRLNDMNGRLICKKLKSHPLSNYFPIILMSASPEYLLNFEEYDADGVIEKPFDVRTIVKKIKSFL